MAPIGIEGKVKCRERGPMGGQAIHRDIAKRLRKIRALCGYEGRGRQKEFATALGFAPNQWNNWEKGYSIPWDRAVQLIARSEELGVVGLTLDYIYRGTRDGMPQGLARRLGPLEAKED